MKKALAIVAAILALIIIMTWESDEEPALGNRVANDIEQAQIEKAFAYYDKDGVDCYGYQYYLADLDGDGTEEMLRSYLEDTKLMSFCVDCYEQTTDTYSRINERTMTDYTLYLYKENLYVLSSQSPFSSFYDTPHAYRPALNEDNHITLQEIDADLEQNILQSCEKEHDLPLWEQSIQ